MDLRYHIAHPNFHLLIVLQISHGEYTLFSAINNFTLRACIESLPARKKFGISERKVHFYQRLEG